jgi:hypothetical protein
MKKILLLLVISVSIYSAKAHSSLIVNNNINRSNTEFAVNMFNTDGIIDNISVYPNPVIDELKISFKSSQQGKAGVALFNNIGKLVYKQESNVEPGNNIISIDIRSKSIEPGVYFIQIQAGNQNFTRKLIVK